jgi:hypothetical protein
VTLHGLALLDTVVVDRFQLYYFSNTQNVKVVKENRETVLTIDTRGGLRPRKLDDDGDDMPIGPLELAIMSKWEGACVDWQGIPPYI